VTSLYETLQQLSDPRRGQGKRYELALLLCLLLLAKMAGEKSLSGATKWIRHRAAVLADQLRLCRKSMPCQMTYCNVLARVDAKHLDDILAAFFVRWEAEQRPRDAQRDASLAEVPSQARSMLLLFSGKRSEIPLPYRNRRAMMDARKPAHC
jgi:hypothetical protein